MKIAIASQCINASIQNQIDDLVDAIALQQTIPWLKQNNDFPIQEICTAVLWCKACSVIAPDYYVDYLADNLCIHQPFEHYEQMNPAELAAKVSQLC